MRKKKVNVFVLKFKIVYEGRNEFISKNVVGGFYFLLGIV